MQYRQFPYGGLCQDGHEFCCDHRQKALTSAVPDTAFAGRGEGKGRMDVGRALTYFRIALKKAIPPAKSQDAPVEDGERTSA